MPTLSVLDYFYWLKYCSSKYSWLETDR